jgi:hypothetical protein
MKMGKPNGKKSEGTNKKIDSGTKCNSKQQVSISFEDFFSFLGRFSSLT